MSDQWADNLAREHLPLFASEAQKDIHAMVDLLLVVERSEGDARDRLLAEVSRGAHNLKGSAAAVNLTEIEEIALRLEMIFRSIAATTQPLQPQLLGVVFEALGVIAALIRRAVTGRPAEII